MLSIPNLFTLLRLILAPVIIQAVLAGRHSFALACFMVASATDGVDGLLARRFGWTTAVGAYLDPIADKVLLSGVYLALALARLVPWWFVSLVFGRDLLILLSAGLAFAFTSFRKFSPSPWGKLSTFLQVVTAVAWLVRNVHPLPSLNLAADALLWASAAATLWSGIHYGYRGVQMWRGQQAGPDPQAH